ncbi:MAG TPA: EAL domain-containing protein, partial [Acidimicrobiales bacterium]|nr:EAL domain-containing protein [Acidimicrobiales bacterium]
MDIERRLSDVLSEFARTLVTDFPIQAILDHLVVRIVDVLPVSAAGVTLISPGADPHYIAASDESAMRFEQLQTELGEGPCLVAYERGEAVVVPDLRADDRFPKFTSRAMAEGLAAVFTFPLRHDDHQLGALDLYRTSPGPMNAGAMTAAQTLADVAAAYLLNAQARSDLRDSSERARESALHDALTGLPNRTLLVQRLVHAILRCRRSEKLVAILFADLDRFKSINDTYGHHVGDELLVAVGARLTELLRPGDTLARLAGDEFVILCEDLDHTSQVEPLAHRIDTALAETFVLSGIEVQVSASVGIAFAGRGDDVPEQILQDADTAMYQAKRKGGARHGMVDVGEQRLADNRATLNRDLRGALARHELRTEYQPIVATADGRITGVEALLRWEHPVRGIVAPATLVPLAEQSGLIVEIGGWVLMQACLDLHRWQRHDRYRGLEICVNISSPQLMAPDFAATVAAVLSATGTDPKLLTLEITESVFIQDSDRALIVLNDLRRLGVKLALDDFGTGYSSLSYLKQFPVNIVKIDRAFIADLGREPTSRLIVSAIVRLAHSLHMTVVAEGIESESQFDEVVALDCDSYQG